MRITGLANTSPERPLRSGGLSGNTRSADRTELQTTMLCHAVVKLSRSWRLLPMLCLPSYYYHDFSGNHWTLS